MNERQIDLVIDKVKTELAAIYNDMTKPIPTGDRPEDMKELREIISVCSSFATTLAVYLRSLEDYIRAESSRITLEAIEGGILKTPRNEYLEALINKELGTVKSYKNQCEEMLKICSNRQRACQSAQRQQSGDW